MDPERDATDGEITRLFEVAGREGETIRRLDGCVAELHEVLEAKAALHRFTAAELRAALQHRHQALNRGQVP